jgi:hypothetical protein
MGSSARLFAISCILSASVALPAHADAMFNRIASFPVASNLPADIAADTPTSSEIVTASPDGNLLIYSDSPLGAVGFVDITDPKAPKAGGIVKFDGEPTSVAAVAGKALAGVNTSKSKAEPSGVLAVIDLASRKVEATCDLGGQPDSLAVSKDGRFLAIAIENERDEDLNDGALPQMPAGNLKIFTLANGAPDCATVKTVDLTGIAAIAPEDPEPEFVDFNDAGEIAVTLQENNHIAIVNAETGAIVTHFSAGSANLENVDLSDDGALDFSESVNDVPREPDAVQWLDNDRLVVANEGDWKGGSRSFSIFSRNGDLLFDSGNALDHQAALVGHYPDRRSDAKGSEPEGAEVATFGDTRYIFVALERASLIMVYRDNGDRPELVQVLPSGVGPEGLVAIPGRNLFVTANEADLVEDGLARSHVMIYERAEGEAVYPTILSTLDSDGRPIGWSALSGLAADPEVAGKLYSISDSAFGGQPAIFEIDATAKPAKIVGKTVLTRNGHPAQKIDLEGVVSDGNGGFWVANEGDAAKLTPHAILRVNGKGEIKTEVSLPVELLAGQTRFGLEGITRIGEGDDTMLVMTVQREWGDDPKGQVKLLAYKPKAKEWSAVRYPLEAAEKGWMGLSDITVHDGKLYILERDNQIGTEAKVKRVYSVSLDAFRPAKLGGDLPLVEKTLVRDLIDDMRNATNGYVVDKVEGFTIDRDGTAYFVTDNDGVDDSSGETIFVNLGNIAALN